MTIGNLEDLVRNIKVETSTHKRTEASPAGARERPKSSATFQVVEEPVTEEELAAEEKDTGRRRRARPGRRTSSGARRLQPEQRPVTSSRPSLTTSMTAIDPSMSVSGGASFGHGVMSQQAKKGSAAITWVLIVVGLSGLGWVAYSVFTMK